jgi:hypothetical protein
MNVTPLKTTSGAIEKKVVEPKGAELFMNLVSPVT